MLRCTSYSTPSSSRDSTGVKGPLFLVRMGRRRPIAQNFALLAVGRTSCTSHLPWRPTPPELGHLKIRSVPFLTGRRTPAPCSDEAITHPRGRRGEARSPAANPHPLSSPGTPKSRGDSQPQIVSRRTSPSLLWDIADDGCPALHRAGRQAPIGVARRWLTRVALPMPCPASPLQHIQMACCARKHEMGRLTQSPRAPRRGRNSRAFREGWLSERRKKQRERRPMETCRTRIY